MEQISLGYVSAEELAHYREAVALQTLAETGHPGLNLEQAVSALVDYGRLLGSLIERFELDEGATIYVNSYNGRVVEGI
jgi:hypothetical protein